MAEAPRTLIVIDDATLINMAANQAFLTQFPFLQGIPLKQPKRAGGCCGGSSARRDMAGVLNAAKVAISRMAPEKQRQLLQMLNARQLKVIYNDGRRVIHKTITAK